MSASSNASPERVYYGYTTYQQRKAMIDIYEATGNIAEACRQAKVCRKTFKRWFPRYQERGIDGLREFESRIPKSPRRLAAVYADRAVELKKAHPKWGKQRIADEICQEHGWQRVVSKKGVKNALERAG